MAAHVLLLPLFAPFPVSIPRVMSLKIFAKEGLLLCNYITRKVGMPTLEENGLDDWEKVTHLTIMLGGGPYSAGNDSMLVSMVTS